MSKKTFENVKKALMVAVLFGKMSAEEMDATLLLLSKAVK